MNPQYGILKFKIWIFIVLYVLFFGISSFPQDMQPMTEAGEFLKKLRETTSATQTIKADFTEEKILSYLKEPHKSTGIFYYKKENKLRLEKIKPSIYIFLVNGDKARVKVNHEEKDVSSFSKALGVKKELMLMLVNGEFHNNKLVTAMYFQNGESYFVKLIPVNKRLSITFDRIELTFSKKTMRLKGLDFYEKSGDKSIMKFYNDTINKNLDDRIFSEF